MTAAALPAKPAEASAGPAKAGLVLVTLIIVAAVANGGPECLLAPRGDLVALLSRPVPLVGALASVSSPTAGPRPSPARSASPGELAQRP
jgi:hypothetical protein